MTRHSPIGASRDGSRNARRDVQSGGDCPIGGAGAPNASTSSRRERDAFVEAFTAFFAGDDAGFDKAIEQFERAHDARVSR
jgi:hypothetical protein